jgi:hypothetical protein
MLEVMMAVVISAAGVDEGRWELPCRSPSHMLAEDAATPGEEIYELTLVTQRPMKTRGFKGFQTNIREEHGPEDPRYDPTVRGKVMHRLGLVELEGEGSARCRLRFQRAKNLEFRMKFDMERPAFGIAYVTRY